ncbi:hypothetical protein B0T10DRAFT_531538 [Thelonectria olida]|uniref:Rhodopsin domain-containing protein n=1 Tax=Thelonectria olida TaxID=1576542 RepID=A0A9P9ALY5_9HYPO|nr:hypothetical protein B0T10DRAFT_531538 [Thelonectria olida]
MRLRSTPPSGSHICIPISVVDMRDQDEAIQLIRCSSLEWTFLVLAITLVVARICVRVFMKRDRLNVSDIWLIIAAFSALGLVVCDTMAYKAHVMDNFTTTSVSIWKSRFAVNYFFDIGMYFPKFSIISFYHKLVPVTKPHMRIALYVLMGITTSCFLVTFFSLTFWCGPNVSSNWSANEHTCRSFTSLVLTRINWSLNFTTEVLNVIFPFPLVLDLKILRRREKIGLMVIFGLGIITVAVSLGRFIFMAKLGDDISIYVWATAEFCVSIIVVSLTALRPLLRKVAQMVTSSVTGSDTNTKTGYRVASAGHQARSTQAKAGRTQNRGICWRSETNTQQGGTVEEDNGSNSSEIQLNNINTNKVLKKEEISISTEEYSNKEHSARPWV